MLFIRLMDTSAVIKEVQKRECLWNPYNLHYKNKNDKHKAWEEVSQAVLPKFYHKCSKEDRRRIMRAVQSRWKTARDAYIKCRITDTRKPTYKAKSTKYVHYHLLQFLEVAKQYEDNVNKQMKKIRRNDQQYVANNVDTENSVSNSTFEVSDEDGEDEDEDDEESDENNDEIKDFDIDINDDFNDKIQELIKKDNNAELNIEFNNVAIKQELPETSSTHTNQDERLPVEDITEDCAETLNAEIPSTSRPIKKRSSMSEFEIKLLRLLRAKFNNTNNSVLHVDDQSFFNCLAPLIKNFDQYQKVMFRTKILELVMDVTNLTSEPNNVVIKQENETYVVTEFD